MISAIRCWLIFIGGQVPNLGESYQELGRIWVVFVPFGRYYPRPLYGALAEWLCSGLQIRVHRFDSGTRLHLSYCFY